MLAVLWSRWEFCIGNHCCCLLGSIVVVSMALFGKLLIGAAYALIYLYATEVFPTLWRAYGLGTASMVGRTGSILAPFVVDLMVSSISLWDCLARRIDYLSVRCISIHCPSLLTSRLVYATQYSVIRWNWKLIFISGKRKPSLPNTIIWLPGVSLRKFVTAFTRDAEEAAARHHSRCWDQVTSWSQDTLQCTYYFVLTNKSFMDNN